MKPFLQLIHLVIFLVPFCANAQEIQQEKPIQKKKIGRIEISSGTGFFFMGSGNDLKDQMTASGLDDLDRNRDTIYFLGPIILDGPDVDYPLLSKAAIYNYTVKYNFTPRHGLMASFGEREIQTVSGFKRYNSAFLRLDSKVKTMAVNYVHNLKNDRHSFHVGPSLVFHSIEQYGTKSQLIRKSLKPGVNLGYAYKILNGKTFFVRLESDYGWSSSINTGSFARDYDRSITNPEPSEVIFESTKVNLSSLNFRIAVGFKLGRVK